eukprot:353414-Chlamydomonas_euryale.AAC.1
MRSLSREPLPSPCCPIFAASFSTPPIRRVLPFNPTHSQADHADHVGAAGALRGAALHRRAAHGGRGAMLRAASKRIAAAGRPALGAQALQRCIGKSGWRILQSSTLGGGLWTKESSAFPCLLNTHTHTH